MVVPASCRPRFITPTPTLVGLLPPRAAPCGRAALGLGAAVASAPALAGLRAATTRLVGRRIAPDFRLIPARSLPVPSQAVGRADDRPAGRCAGPLARTSSRPTAAGLPLGGFAHAHHPNRGPGVVRPSRGEDGPHPTASPE